MPHPVRLIRLSKNRGGLQPIGRVSLSQSQTSAHCDSSSRPTKFDGIESGKNLRSTHTSQERYNLNPHLLGDRIADDTVHRLESRPPRRTQKSQLHPPFPEPRPSYA